MAQILIINGKGLAIYIPMCIYIYMYNVHIYIHNVTNQILVSINTNMNIP